MKHSPDYTHLPVDEEKILDKIVDILPGLIVELNARELLTLCIYFEDLCHKYEKKGS